MLKPISLLDKDLNNLYEYETEFFCFGIKKQILHSKKSDIYVNIVSTRFKKQIVRSNLLENIEKIQILKQMNQMLSCMRIPDMKFILLNSFDDLKKKCFFSQQILLNGKSIFDINIRDADEVHKAIYESEM